MGRPLGSKNKVPFVLEPKSRTCGRCGTDFLRVSSRKFAGLVTCTPCRLKWKRENHNPVFYAKRHRKHYYNVTDEMYETLLAHQGGVCAICHLTNGDKNFCIDHDDVTKEVRGLLCDNCNRFVGLAKDSSDNCRNAAEYIDNPPARIIGSPVVNVAKVDRMRRNGHRLSKRQIEERSSRVK